MWFNKCVIFICMKNINGSLIFSGAFKALNDTKKNVLTNEMWGQFNLTFMMLHLPTFFPEN